MGQVLLRNRERQFCNDFVMLSFEIAIESSQQRNVVRSHCDHRLEVEVLIGPQEGLLGVLSETLESQTEHDEVVSGHSIDSAPEAKRVELLSLLQSPQNQFQLDSDFRRESASDLSREFQLFCQILVIHSNYNSS